jgi:uncharacterized protein YjbJ (UPF0337 family)
MTDKHVLKAKGRAKEAAGVLTGDRRLKVEGRIDQAESSLKQAVDTVSDTLSDSAKAKKQKNDKQKSKKQKQKQSLR